MRPSVRALLALTRESLRLRPPPTAPWDGGADLFVLAPPMRKGREHFREMLRLGHRVPPPPAYGQVDVAGRTMKMLRNACSAKLLSYATSAADDERLLQKHSLSFGEAALDKLRLWEKCALAA